MIKKTLRKIIPIASAGPSHADTFARRFVFKDSPAFRAFEKTPRWLQKVALPVVDACGAYRVDWLTGRALRLERQYKATAGEFDRRVSREKFVEAAGRLCLALQFVQTVKYLRLRIMGIDELPREIQDKALGFDANALRAQQFAKTLDSSIALFERSEPTIGETQEFQDSSNVHFLFPDDYKTSLAGVAHPANNLGDVHK